MKESVEEENERLRAELNEARAKAAEGEKKKLKYKGEIKDMQGLVSSL